MPYTTILDVREDILPYPTVHTNMMSVAGERAEFISEIDKPRTGLSESKFISLLCRNFQAHTKRYS